MSHLKALLRQGFFLSAVCLSAVCVPAFAALEIASDTALAIKPDTARLAQDPYWLRLLQNPNPQLAQAELLDNQAAFAIAATDDNSPACRYPARRAWLAEQRPDWAAQWPTPVCPALKRWLDAIDAQQATLVFASDYLNNPSSMFGHTLLRIDAKTQTDDTRLLAYAVNYAAQTNTSNGLEFAIKGLTGGYPGKFSLLPYYEKVKEYNDWESRDLWEYELDLTPAEVHRLLLTYWDWRDTTAPYYFLSKNCSYALLGLLEMARPGLRLQAQFPAQAIPTDTLRAVLAEPHMLRRMTWRPASGTRRNAAIERNPRAVNQAVKSLIDLDAPLPASLELAPEQQAQAFETAYDELYARYLARQVPKDIAPPRLRNLLTLRSQVDIPDQRVAPAQPAADPSQGHGTARWGIGAGHDDESMALLSYRGAYHDWLDPQAGYREGARIDFLTGTLRINKDGKVGVQDATVVAIDSLAPASVLQQPLSWSLRVGADHVLGDRRDADSHTVAVVEGGAGMSARWGQTLCHAQYHNDVRGGQGLGKGWEIGVGARTGCLGALPSVRGQEARWMLDESDFRTGGPSRYVTVRETGGRLGFITPLTNNFCAGCNRIRVTATGQLYACLGGSEMVDLRGALRSDEPDAQIAAALDEAMRIKPEKHHFRIEAGAGPAQPRHMSVTGG